MRGFVEEDVTNANDWIKYCYCHSSGILQEMHHHNKIIWDIAVYLDVAVGDQTGPAPTLLTGTRRELATLDHRLRQPQLSLGALQDDLLHSATSQQADHLHRPESSDKCVLFVMY
jgi:hypothetical protein